MTAETNDVRVVIADPLGDEIVDGLTAIGLAVSSPDKPLSPAQLSSELAGASILIVGNSPVLRGAIERASSLALIARVGEGPGQVDVKAASDRGVVVSHTPAFDAESRAERLVTLIGMLDAGIDLTNGFSGVGRGLRQSALGIAGSGPASAAVAAAAAAMGMRVRAWSPELTSARASETGAGFVDSFDGLIARSDVLCLMEPAASLTTERVAALKDGAQLLVGRAGVAVDIDAISKRLSAGSLGLGALHDSVDEQATTLLRDTGGAIILDGGQLDTFQSRCSAGIMLTQSVRELLRHQPASYALNLIEPTPGSTLLLVRHSTDTSCIASLFGQLRSAEIRLTDIDNRLFVGGETAVSRIRLCAPPSPSLLQRLAATRGVIAIDAITA